MSRTAYLSERFNEWLDRYAPPRFIADKPQTMQEEADTLLRIVARHAPTDDYAEWLDGVLRALTEGMQARTWPTGGEVSKACQKANTHRPKHAQTEWKLDPVAINARRMNAGEAVGDEWLYGRRAVELQQSGLVSADRVQQYRSGLFFKLKQVYGEPEALRMEAVMRKRHADAECPGDVWDRGYAVSPRRMPQVAE